MMAQKIETILVDDLTGEPAQEAAEIRVWARQNGYAVAGRGRIPRDVVQAYRQAV
jgi:hypothetical protein